MQHIAPAADLRGVKASEVSSIPRRTDLAQELGSDSLLGVTGLTVPPEGFSGFLLPVMGMDRIRSGVMLRSGRGERERSDESSGRKLSAYRRNPDRERPRGRTLANLNNQTQYLEPIPWGAV